MKIWGIRKNIREYNENLRNKEGYKRIHRKIGGLKEILEDTMTRKKGSKRMAS